MKISIIIPVYNAALSIDELIRSLKKQSDTDFEVVFVDDHSPDNTIEILEKTPFRLIRMEKNRGPAYCRNAGASAASGDVLAFTDSDCILHRDWIRNIRNAFMTHPEEVVMGKVVLPPSSILGDSISALGFPAGGSVGFEKIWKVDIDGFTKSLSTCNCAMPRKAFEEIGGFDTSFPYPGGEDTLLARHIVQSGKKIRFRGEIIVYHEARDSLKSFLKWQFKRGMSAFIFSGKVEKKGDFLGLRIWSTKNILVDALSTPRFPLVATLLITGYVAQFIGFFFAKYDKRL